MSARSDEGLDRELPDHALPPRLYRFEMDRRGFLEVLGGGVLVLLAAPASAQESGRGARARPEAPKELSAWIHVGREGNVTVFTGKVEVGQNIRTSLAQQVAEELRVPLTAITVVMGDTDRTPWDAGTFGSRTTPTMGPQLRRAAAAAREALIDLAVERWKTDRFGLSAADGKVTDRSGRALTYGVLTEGRDLLRIVDEETATTPPKEWRVAGAPAKKVGGRDFVTGRHEYASDVSRPGMLYGKILRPAGFRATLASLDAAKAEAMPGVKVVRDGDFVGVAAPDPAAARRALSALEARWSESPGQPSDREIFEFLKKNAGPADDRGTVGSIDAALSAAEVKASGAYTVAYIAHAPLEPRAAVAEWSGGKLTVWTGTQRPFAVRDELAESLRLPPEGVRVIVPDTGSAYGGKHTGDAAIEAARLAKAAGKPVRVVWTREEEFTWAYFRPAGLIEVASGAGKDGKITAWEFHNYNSGPAAIGTPYDVPNRRIAYHPVDSPLRQGSYRALAATANHFARETHMDELAHEIGTDPLAFRLKNLADKRLSAVFEAAADKFGWSRAAPGPRRGFGIAGGLEKGGYVAACVEVEVDESTRRLRLVRIVQAFECGAVVNPDGIRNQIEGSVVQGLGGALFEAVRFENGRISNPHFAQYRVPRFPDVPPIELVVLDRKDLPPAGASETPIVAVAPAIGNAVFRAAGVRLRALPLVPDGIVRPTGAAEPKPAGTPGI